MIILSYKSEEEKKKYMKIGIKQKKAVCEFDFTYGLVITLQINHQSNIASTTNSFCLFVAFPFIQLEYNFFSANYFISADTYIVFLFRFQFLYFSRSSFLLLNKN